MKPAEFEYFAPTSLEEVIELSTARADKEVRLLAGGQSLVPLMNFRLAQPEVLLDLQSVEGLADRQRVNGALRLGAMVRQQDAMEDAEISAACPLLRQAAGFVGHVQIRNRGTLGGSLAHADPAAEYPAVALALGATLVARGPNGERRIEAHDFFRGPFTTALDPTEVLTEVELPCWANRSHFSEVARRRGDFAIAAVAVALRTEGDAISRAGVGLAGVGPAPIRAEAAEEVLAGKGATEELLKEAAEAAADGVDPSGDIHGTPGFRRDLVRVLTLRSLRASLSAPTEGGLG